MNVEMNPVPSLHRPEFRNEHQVADYLNLNVSTIRKWRQTGKGPRALKFGAAVRYRQADVDEWLATRPEIGGEGAAA